MAAGALRAGDQALPKRIGRYEAFLQIGAGGMSRVFLAIQRGVSGQKPELVVVKILRPEVVEDEHVLSLFADEARIAMRLEHPNVIRTREVVAGPRDYLLAMDFHDGRSLLDVVSRLGRQAVPVDEHIYVLSKVLAGLSYAHELKDESGRPFGIVHRDVSPANVLVTYSGQVKLLDFGIAKATGALAATRDGVVRGKLGYAAPEQCLGRPADPRSDIYAVGVMLWEAVAGKRRVSGETWQSVLQARLDDTEPSLEEACPDAPPALRAIVERALARNPDDRYPTAKEFQADLEKYLSDKRTAIGPHRIAAMLKPHFDQDRAELHRAIEKFLNSLRSAKTGQVSRIPLPGSRAASPPPAAQEAPRPAAAAPAQEETTAPIPVDAALLMQSRAEADAAALSSTPTVPPPAGPSATTAPPPPSALTTARPPAPPLTTTAPPPPGPVATTAPPPPEAAATPSTPVAEAEPARSATEGALSSDAAHVIPSPPPKASPALTDAYGLVGVSRAPVPPSFDSSAIGATLPKKRTPLWPFAVLAVGAVGLAAVVFAPRRHVSNESAATGADPNGDAPRSPSAATPAAAQKIDTVKVRISVDPADAVVTLDGKVLSGNPYVATLPRDNADHELTAVAEECQDRHQVVHLNSDLALLVAMKCQRQGLRLTARPPVRRPTPSAPASAQAVPVPETRTAAPVVSAPAQAPAPPPAPAAPASDNPYN
jgi:serine/threonine-protein kinase